MKGLSVEYHMYYGAKPSIFKLARELRKDQTRDEKILWEKLNKNQINGLKFRRQHPINKFIADFFCPKIKLVIEVDGSIHEIIEFQNHDEGRTDFFNDFGITVIRFTNEQIYKDLDSIIKQINDISEKLLKESQDI
jgi:very-short-patch-repair endonuclease